MSRARDEAVALVVGAMQLDAADVDGSVALGVTPEWDSLAHMRLVIALEERLGRELQPEQIVTLTSFDSVVALLEGERGSA